MDDDVESSEPMAAPCSAVRVTPYGSDGPDHVQAHTWHFEPPVTLACIYQQRIPTFDDTRPFNRALPSLVAFLAPDDHPQEGNVLGLDRCLSLLDVPRVSVEGWSAMPGGDWNYLHIPNWARTEPDGWTAQAGNRIRATGKALPTPGVYRWPAPSPHHEGRVDRGTQIVVSTSVGPPPEAGFRPDTAHAGHRTRV
ncbi:hypothetical protein ACFY0G_17460 [Streptomyces sp. NPDC001552]|uniref:hypothetical protein n=1 Tax=Streptomyces sp. NPDC001552 TaxID=3364587 RepID=UPI0036A421EF